MHLNTSQPSPVHEVNIHCKKKQHIHIPVDTSLYTSYSRKIQYYYKLFDCIEEHIYVLIVILEKLSLRLYNTCILFRNTFSHKCDFIQYTYNRFWLRLPLPSWYLCMCRVSFCHYTSRMKTWCPGSGSKSL